MSSRILLPSDAYIRDLGGVHIKLGRRMPPLFCRVPTRQSERWWWYFEHKFGFQLRIDASAFTRLAEARQNDTDIFVSTSATSVWYFVFCAHLLSSSMFRHWDRRFLMQSLHRKINSFKRSHRLNLRITDMVSQWPHGKQCLHVQYMPSRMT